MATLIRSAKSSDDWTQNDAASYHITIDPVDPLIFFDVQELPPPSVDQELLDVVDARGMQQARHEELIGLLDIAECEEPCVVDFSDELLKVLGYVHRERLARTRMDLTLFICGEERHGRTDVCIQSRSSFDVLLLVKKHKRRGLSDPLDTRAQLIAEAVAAFDKNNMNREAAGLPRLTEKIMPGIVMAGTLPSFFKIPVTQTLSTHIAFGTYPPDETHVTFCYPPLPRGRYLAKGMKGGLDYRREILMCYEAFKMIVGMTGSTCILL